MRSSDHYRKALEAIRDVAYGNATLMHEIALEALGQGPNPSTPPPDPPVQTLAGTKPHPIEGDEDINPLWYCPVCGLVYFLPNEIAAAHHFTPGSYCRNENHGIHPQYTPLVQVTPSQLKELQWKQKPSTAK